MTIGRIRAVCCLVLCMMGTLLAADSVVNDRGTGGAKLTADEVAELEQLEQMQMTKSEKARFDRWAATVMSCAFDGTRLSSTETEEFRKTSDESLGEMVALGSRSVGETLGLSIPNVLLDTLDCFSFACGVFGIVGIPLGAVELHVTRYAGLGAGAQVNLMNLHWNFNRNLAVSAESLVAIAKAGPYEAYYLNFFGAGLSWKDGRPSSGFVRFKKVGKFSRADEAVQQGYSDPWAIGAGWALEFHPVEFVDFVTGLFTLTFIDLSKDDFGNPERQRIKSYMVKR